MLGSVIRTQVVTALYQTERCGPVHKVWFLNAVIHGAAYRRSVKGEYIIQVTNKIIL